MVDEQLLSGIAELDRQHQVQHVGQALDQLRVRIQVPGPGGVEPADDGPGMQGVEKCDAGLRPFHGMQGTEGAFRDGKILFLLAVWDIDQFLLQAVGGIVDAGIDVQETPVEADVRIGQDGGGHHPQEGVRLLLHQQAFHRVIQVVLMVVQGFAPAVDGQRVIADVLRGGAAAGLGEDRPEGMAHHEGRLPAGVQFPEQPHDFLGQGPRIVAAGTQAGLCHIGRGRPVEAGDDHVLRNADPVPPQGVADGDGHGVVGTEDGVRHPVPGTDHFPDDFGGGLGPVIPVGYLVRPEGKPAFLQDLLVAFQAAFGVRFVLHPGDEAGIPGTVVPDDVAEQGLVALLIVVDDGPAAGQLHAGENHRDAVGLRAADDLPDQVVVMEAVADDENQVKQFVPDRPEAGAGRPVLLLIPIKIHRTVEDRDAVAFFSRGGAQFVQEAGIQKIVYLREADSDAFLPVSHGGNLPRNDSGLSFCYEIRQSIA